MHAILCYSLLSANVNEESLIHVPWFVHSDVEAEETQAASLVFSSQIPGYDGGEVNTTETVEITFPLIVRNCMRTFSYFYHKMIRYDRI